MGSINPTGKKAKWTGIDIVQIAEGKIAARWTERDLLGLMQQLGVVQLP
jgi:predicted ester cyclase